MATARLTSRRSVLGAAMGIVLRLHKVGEDLLGVRWHDALLERAVTAIKERTAGQDLAGVVKCEQNSSSDASSREGQQAKSSE